MVAQVAGGVPQNDLPIAQGSAAELHSSGNYSTLSGVKPKASATLPDSPSDNGAGAVLLGDRAPIKEWPRFRQPIRPATEVASPGAWGDRRMSAPSPRQPPTAPGLFEALAVARQGSNDTLELLLEACRPHLLQLAECELAPRAAADLVRRALMDTRQTFAGFGGATGEELLAWLEGILRNHLAAFSRPGHGPGPGVAVSGAPAPRGRPVEVPSPSSVAMARALTEACAGAFQRLPEEFQKVIWLRHRDNRPFSEISSRMACPPGAARLLWSRAVERLQQELGGPMEASHRDAPAEPFARLLELYDEALAAGRTPEPLDDRDVPEALRARLRNAWACLKLLEVLWPRVQQPSTRDTMTEDEEQPSTEFEVDLPPERLGRFRILEELGRGGMGVVYKAWQEELKRPVALKVIRSAEFASPQVLSRFRTEANAVARLQHPNIVQLHDIGEVNGQPYLCLEYVGGGNLAQYLGGRRQPARLATELVEQLARAMAFVHQRGIVHRDLKPSNILLQPLRPEGRGQRRGGREPTQESAGEELDWDRASLSSGVSYLPKITDFGLAKVLDVNQMWTQTGMVLGTPCYMAPEQAHGRVHEVGPATDVYALGAIFYELLTGRPPFHGQTIMETLDRVRMQEPVPPRCVQATVPRDLESVCLKCLEKEPGKRYASAGALADDLARWLHGERTRARPPRWLERMGRYLRRQLPLRFAAACGWALPTSPAGNACGLAKPAPRGASHRAVG
jgi:DNA-directed RNA polymerase specialized sigma24 family protein